MLFLNVAKHIYLLWQYSVNYSINSISIIIILLICVGKCHYYIRLIYLLYFILLNFEQCMEKFDREKERERVRRKKPMFYLFIETETDVKWKYICCIAAQITGPQATNRCAMVHYCIVPCTELVKMYV